MRPIRKYALEIHFCCGICESPWPRRNDRCRVFSSQCGLDDSLVVAFFVVAWVKHRRSCQKFGLKKKSLEDAVDDVATDGGTGAENSSVAHLLAEFLAVLFEFAGGSSGLRAACVGYVQRHVAVAAGAGLVREWWSALFVDYVYVGSREDAFETCSFVSPSPPWDTVSWVKDGLGDVLTVVVHVF
jgi:hypothetical protein